MSWLTNNRDWIGMRSAEQLFKLAESRQQLATVITLEGPDMVPKEEDDSGRTFFNEIVDMKTRHRPS